jgi:hypothetical protein
MVAEEFITDSSVEEVLDWLEQMDRQGLAIPLEEMERMLKQAPEPARTTEEYHYLRGLYDGRFLNEGLGSRTCF